MPPKTTTTTKVTSTVSAAQAAPAKPGKHAKRNAKRRAKNRSGASRPLSNRSRMGFNANMMKLWASLIDPFDEVPPLIGAYGEPKFSFTLYDRRLLTISTDGSLLMETYPSVGSSTSLASALNIFIPVTANHAAAWTTANTTYAAFSTASVFETNVDLMMPVCGGMRIIPTGVLTGSSGVIFGGLEPINDNTYSVYGSNTPANTLTNVAYAQTSRLVDGAMSLWRPGNIYGATNYINSSSIEGAGTAIGQYVSGLFLGILGGTNTQTVFVETVYHCQGTPIPNTACLFAETTDGMTTEEVELVYQQMAREVPTNFVPHAATNIGAAVRYRVGGGRASSSSAGSARVAQTLHNAVGQWAQVDDSSSSASGYAASVLGGVASVVGTYGLQKLRRPLGRPGPD